MLIKNALATMLFASRWLLSLFYILLIVGLIALIVKAGQHGVELILHIGTIPESAVILALLGLIDLTLTGALVVIVIFSGYENFVAASTGPHPPSWPTWMSTIDFTGLKLKILSSIVTISAIQLLRSFMDVANIQDRALAWQTGIHMVFVVSSLVLAWTDRMASLTEASTASSGQEKP